MDHSSTYAAPPKRSAMKSLSTTAEPFSKVRNRVTFDEALDTVKTYDASPWHDKVTEYRSSINTAWEQLSKLGAASFGDVQGLNPFEVISSNWERSLDRTSSSHSTLVALAEELVAVEGGEEESSEDEGEGGEEAIAKRADEGSETQGGSADEKQKTATDSKISKGTTVSVGRIVTVDGKMSVQLNRDEVHKVMNILWNGCHAVCQRLAYATDLRDQVVAIDDSDLSGDARVKRTSFKTAIGAFEGTHAKLMSDFHVFGKILEQPWSSAGGREGQGLSRSTRQLSQDEQRKRVLGDDLSQFGL